MRNGNTHESVKKKKTDKRKKERKKRLSHLSRRGVGRDPEDGVSLVGERLVVVVEADGLDGAAAWRRSGKERKEGERRTVRVLPPFSSFSGERKRKKGSFIIPLTRVSLGVGEEGDPLGLENLLRFGFWWFGVLRKSEKAKSG